MRPRDYGTKNLKSLFKEVLRAIKKHKLRCQKFKSFFKEVLRTIKKYKLRCQKILCVV